MTKCWPKCKPNFVYIELTWPTHKQCDFNTPIKPHKFNIMARTWRTAGHGYASYHMVCITLP